MARIRSIKPEIWEDEALAEVSTSARLLFIGLITQADDEGRLPGRTRWIASKIFPYDDDISPQDIEGWVDELHSVGLISYYEVEGRPYIWLCSFGKHQSIDKRWRKESQFPPPPQEATPSARRAHAETSSQSEESAQESASPDRTGLDRRGEDRKGGESPLSRADAPLSHLLADLVAENDPNGKRPNVTKRWAEEEDRLLRLDGRKPEEAERLIRWTQNDSFWRGNVLSMPKFREKYGQLYQAAVEDSQKRNGRQPAVARSELSKYDQVTEEVAV